MPVLDSERYAADLMLQVPNVSGHRKYQVDLVVVTTVGGDRPGHGGTKTVSITPLTNGPNAVNVRAKQVSDRDVVLSNNMLDDKDWVIGPFAFPYNVGTVSGGFDPVNFTQTGSDPLELWIRIQGDGMAPGGSFFKKIWDQMDRHVVYRIFIRSNGAKPSLS